MEEGRAVVNSCSMCRKDKESLDHLLLHFYQGIVEDDFRDVDVSNAQVGWEFLHALKGVRIFIFIFWDSL